MKRTVLIAALVIVGIALGIAAIAYVEDVHADRRAILRVTGPLKVYDRESPPGYQRGDEGVIFVLHQGDPVQVVRIHESEGVVEDVHIRLRDGREGYIFCCDNFEISR
jgi:hypothetical protein